MEVKFDLMAITLMVVLLFSSCFNHYKVKQEESIYCLENSKNASFIEIIESDKLNIINFLMSKKRWTGDQKLLIKYLDVSGDEDWQYCNLIKDDSIFQGQLRDMFEPMFPTGMVYTELSGWQYDATCRAIFTAKGDWSARLNKFLILEASSKKILAWLSGKRCDKTYFFGIRSEDLLVYEYVDARQLLNFIKMIELK